MRLSKDIFINRRYLNLPVQKDAAKRCVSLLIDGAMLTQSAIELAAGCPDYWVFADLGRHMGKRITIELETDDDTVLKTLELSDRFVGQESIYSETYRPQFHFSSKRGWLNDPVGLHYHQGRYHLFYQHNPYGVGWGNMHWGHAVSDDLVHWAESGDALFPDDTGTMFSGSGVVDLRNTAGFGAGAEAPQVLIYTAAGGTNPLSQGKPFTQCLAYSTDGGLNWSKYGGNPVIPHLSGENRDPKAFWHEATNGWILALYLSGSSYALFSSPDLKSWERACDIDMPGCSECPDFFPLPADGDRGNIKWIFWAATRGSYVIGSFDGKKFTPECGILHTLVVGAHSYAAQTWNGIPDENGRRIQMSWANFNLPGMPFNCYMTFPCELTLRSTKNGYRLYVWPVREIEALYTKKHTMIDTQISHEIRLPGISCGQLDIRAVLAVGSAKSIGMEVKGTPVTYNAEDETLACGNQVCRLEHDDEGIITLRILVDTVSIELFGNGGAVYMPMGVLFENPEGGIRLFAGGGTGEIRKLEINELKSIWRT